MLGALLRLVPALRWPTVFAVQGAGREKVAIDTCNVAVDLYFPCNSSTTVDYTCLCDQYLWRLSCYDKHASTSLSHTDWTTTENDMESHCRAAGSIGADMVQQRHRLHSRQIEDIFSSIVGGVSSVLSSNGVTVPTAAITSAVGSVVDSFPTPANPTSIAAAITSDIGTSATSEPSSSATTSDEPTSSDAPTSPDASPTESAAATISSEDASSSTAAAAASSDSSSGPSTGLIAGVVVGGVAALALIGIFVLLLLRHRKRKSNAAGFTDKEASPTLSSRDDHSPPAAYATLPHNTYTHNQHSDTYAPTETNTYSTGNTTLSPVSPMTPGGNAPWESSTSTFDGRALSGSGYPDEKAHHHHHHHQKTQPIPEGNEMPTTANVWEIDGREVPPPSELGDGKRDDMAPSARVDEVERQSGDTYGTRRKSETGNWSGKEGEFLGSVPVGQAI